MSGLIADSLIDRNNFVSVYLSTKVFFLARASAEVPGFGSLRRNMDQILLEEFVGSIPASLALSHHHLLFLRNRQRRSCHLLESFFLRNFGFLTLRIQFLLSTK